MIEFEADVYTQNTTFNDSFNEDWILSLLLGHNR